MAMGGGQVQSAPPPPPEPIPQVPQDDDPNGIMEAQRTIRANRNREGSQKHLLTGSSMGDTSDPGVTRARLTPTEGLLK